jgi:hypothetical protein
VTVSGATDVLLVVLDSGLREETYTTLRKVATRFTRARVRTTTLAPGRRRPSVQRSGRRLRQSPREVVIESTSATRRSSARRSCGSSRRTAPTAGAVPRLRTRVLKLKTLPTGARRRPLVCRTSRSAAE